MNQPAPSFLDSAVDLSTLARPANTDDANDNPGEFSVAIVGDQRGRPHVMMAFGHLQWVFEPKLAADLAAVLADAATQAAAMPPQGPALTPNTLPGTIAEVPQ